MSITLPIDLIGLHEKFNFETLAAKLGIQSETNRADGFVTIKMSKNQQTEALKVIRELVDESISDTLQDEMMNVYYSDIEVNDECSKIQVNLFPDSEFGMVQEMGLLPVKISCMIYQAFNGEDDYGTNVSIINNETKAVIKEYYYSSNEL